MPCAGARLILIELTVTSPWDGSFLSRRSSGTLHGPKLTCGFLISFAYLP